MKKGKIVITASGALLVVLLIISLLLWPVNTIYAQGTQPLTPANGALIDCDPVPGRSVPITFSWSPFMETTKYKFVVSKDAAMTQVVDEIEVTTTVYQYSHGRPNPLEYGTSYFWRVMAIEPVSYDWSATFSFMIKSTSMPTQDYYGVRLLSPNDGAIGCPVKPASFSWSPFKETTTYKFVLAKDAAMTQIVAEVMVATTAYEYNGTLENATNYFWCVMAIEPAPSYWSATFAFQTGGEPPLPAPPSPPAHYGVMLLSPDNGYLGYPVKAASFSWSPCGVTTKYKFQLARNAAMTQVVKEAEVSTTAYEYDGTLDYSSNYFWRVMALEPALSDWSATFSFTTEDVAWPQTVQLEAPSNGSLGVPVKPSPIFIWEHWKNITKYEFVLAKDASMTNIVTQAQVTRSSYGYSGTLSYSTNYFWRVRALEPSPTDWSATFVFQTEPKPGVAVPAPVPPTGSQKSSPAGLSCSMASIDQKTTSLDGSMLLFGALFVGLVVANKKKWRK